MKTDTVVLTILVVAAGFAVPVQGWSEVTETVEQHLKRAESYGVMIEFAKADLRSYRREKDYAKRSGSLSSDQVRADEKEYDDLIDEEEVLLADFKLLEKWHQIRAKELQASSTLSRNAVASAGYIFDHSIYGKVIHSYVADGKVDYQSLKKQSEDLDAYFNSLSKLSKKDYEKMDSNEQMAFWINVYNATAIKLVIDHYPLGKGLSWKALAYPSNSVQQIPDVWNRPALEVFGEKLSLNHIEHEILRKEFKELRIHFALVCASLGCPVLRSEPYVADKLDFQLNDQISVFLADPKKFRYDADTDTIKLSPIFKWFKEDFERVGGIILFLKAHLPKGIAGNIFERTKIEWLDYDWSLNERKDAL